jgi:DNA invertase Pin-like site-specific DNA recombinase
MLTMLGGVAQFEREIMLERQAVSKAKADGKYRGRKPTAKAKAIDIRTPHAHGIGATEIAKRLGIGRASVYRAFVQRFVKLGSLLTTTRLARETW